MRNNPSDIQAYWASLTPEEAKAKRTANGLASSASKRKKKAMMTLANYLLEMDMVDTDEVKEALRLRGIDDEYLTEAAGILFAQMQKARHGDTDAARFIRDTAGQKPAENLAIGNMDDKPFESLDLSKLTSEQLAELVENGETRAETD